MHHVCSLSAALRDWMLLHPDAVNPQGSAVSHARVLMVGCTVYEATVLLQGLTAAFGPELVVNLYCPLGDETDLYKYAAGGSAAGSDDQENLASNALANMLKNYEQLQQIQVQDNLLHADYPTIASLPDREFDCIIFGPLAFGVVNDGAGARSAVARAAIISEAALKTPLRTGAVVFLARERSPWQNLVLGAEAEDTALQMQAALDSEHARADASFTQVRTGALESILDLPDSTMKNLHSSDAQTFIAVQTYGHLTADDVPMDLENARRAGGPSAKLVERAFVYVVVAGNFNDDGDSGATGARSMSDLQALGSPGTAETFAAINSPGSVQQDSLNSPTIGAAPSPWWPDGVDGDFYNVGLEAWQQQRGEWLSPQGEAEPTHAAPIPYEEVISGLASLRRTYDLPRPMRLSDLIDIYLDIWESQDGY